MKKRVKKVCSPCTQTAKPTTRKKKPPRKKFQDSEAYQRLHILRKVPVRKEFIIQVAKDLIEWAANDETALAIRLFHANQGIRQCTLDKWAKRTPFLAEAIDFAKTAIGVRRELQGMSRKQDPNFIFKSMPIYDNDYRDLKEWESKLKEKEASAGQPLTTYINKMETAQLKERAKKLKQKD